MVDRLVDPRVFDNFTALKLQMLQSRIAIIVFQGVKSLEALRQGERALQSSVP